MTSPVCSKCDCVKGCGSRSESCAILLAECVGSGQVSPKQIEEHQEGDAAPAVNLKFGPEDFGIPAVYAAYAENYANWKAIAQPQQSAAMPVFLKCISTPYGMVPSDDGNWVQLSDVAASWTKTIAQPEQPAQEGDAKDAVLTAAKAVLEFHDAPADAKRPDVFARRMNSLRAAIAQPKDKPAAWHPTETAITALKRFEETCSDDEGYDVPKDTMRNLAAIGLIYRTHGNTYCITAFGQHVLATNLAQPEQTAPPEQPCARCHCQGETYGARSDSLDFVMCPFCNGSGTAIVQPKDKP